MESLVELKRREDGDWEVDPQPVVDRNDVFFLHELVNPSQSLATVWWQGKPHQVSIFMEKLPTLTLGYMSAEAAV